MNFSFGVIAVVGVLAAISIGLISMSPDGVPQESEMGPLIDFSSSTDMSSMDSETMDSETMDSETMDSETMDSETMDSETMDSETMDSETMDSETMDSETMDSETMDSETMDSETMDSETMDSETMDSETMDSETMDSDARPMSIAISLPEGSGVPGCEETNECYIPYQADVAVGALVTWNNDDSAAHTVTSGTVESGATGLFDSGLFLAGASFEYTFDTAGTFDYFCIVHPWMAGIINVQ